MRFQPLAALTVVGLILLSSPTAFAAEPEPLQAAAPEAHTGGSESFDEGRARGQLLFGVVKIGGVVSRVEFQFGRTKAYGRRAYDFEHPYGYYQGSLEKAEGAALRLHADTTYHYRLVAWNEAGKSFGKDRTFHTRPRAAPVRH